MLSYDVYIHHYRPEPKIWASFLYRSLRDRGLSVFLDTEELQAGSDIKAQVEVAIRSALVHIPIFSKNYAKSVWCLNELVLMLKSGAPILPVFWDVDPAEFCWCKGACGDAFREHESKGRYRKEQIEEWKTALHEVSKVRGWKLDENAGDKRRLLEEIVDTVIKVAKERLPLAATEYKVGLHEAVEIFDRKMAEFAQERQKNAKLVAIVGTGGSGKTTLAEHLFNVKRSSFDASCFLSVRDASAMGRLRVLQEKLLKELLHLDCAIYKKSHGREILTSRFATVRTSSRFLIVLDDIDHNDQVDDLLVKDVLRTDSLIIITSRDSGLFRSRPEAILYKMAPMHESHARKLFCMRAFHQCEPDQGFENLVDGFLRVCDGLPLLLKVCGALLCGKSDLNNWEFQLYRLSEVPNSDLEHKLQISYDALEKDEKLMLLAYEGLTESAQDAFLDICWLFDGWEWETVASIVGEVELETLSHIHLVTRDIDKVRMCYAALKISRKISKGLRITTTEELSLVLEQNQNVEEIKAIWLMDNKVRFELPAEKLDQMHRSLRILALGDWTVIKSTCNNRFESLRFLQAGNVPLLPFNIANLDQLRLLQNGSGQEMGFSTAGTIPPTLRKLEMCQTHYYSGLDLTSQVVINLQNLRSLGLKEFVGLFMLPDKFKLLSQLTRLDLTGCSLLKLPEALDQLSALEHLNLSYCRGLRKLPERLGELCCLTTLNLQFCTKLSQLPESFGMLDFLRILNLKGCRSLQTLPVSFGLLSSLEDLNLCGCTNLRFLPRNFDLLPSLRALNLKKCQNLLYLPYNIGNLPLISFKMKKCSKLQSLPSSMGKLTSLQHRYMSMNGCFALEELPEEFCQLNYTERLDLSCSTALKRLPDRLMDMASLTYLNLEKCENIVDLPEGFGKLNSLRDLILNSCIRLENLCEDFEDLASLEKLMMRNCPIIEGKWMDIVVKIRSLKLADVTESWKLTDRWTEIRSEENEWDMNVKFYQADGDAEKEMMRKAASMFFSDECVLFDAYGCKIRPSTLAPNTTLAFVFDRRVSKDRWKQVVGDIKALHNTSLDLQIIHITNCTPNPPCLGNQDWILEPKGTTLSLSYRSTKVLLAFQRILSQVVGSAELEDDYVVTTTVEEEIKGIKLFSRWKNISGLLKKITSKSESRLRIKKQLRTPKENNLETLRALLVTEGRDFLLNKDAEQVKVDALRGLKLVLLLISRIEIHEIEILILKQMYTKLRNNAYEFEVVWMPIVSVDNNETWGSYVRAASSMPWLTVADPWSMETAVLEVVKQDWDFGNNSSSRLVAVDEKGRIINKDAMGMVWRWGVEAYPFADDASANLLEAEWEQLNKKSSLEFLFQILESFSEVVKKAKLQRQMIWLYGGDPAGNDISDFALTLIRGLRLLDANDINIIYVGGPSFPSAIELMNMQETFFHENNRQRLYWQSLPFPDALRFWRRVEGLWWEIRDKGHHGMFKRLRKLLVALLSANNISRSRPEAAVWVVALDENGEMVTSRGKDVIDCLIHDDKCSSAYKEIKTRNVTRNELIEGSKRGELTQIIKRRFQDGVNFTSHHPRHPLLPFTAAGYTWPGVTCDGCYKEITADLSFFKCTICKDIDICEACMGLSQLSRSKESSEVCSDLERLGSLPKAAKTDGQSEGPSFVVLGENVSSYTCPYPPYPYHIIGDDTDANRCLIS